MPWGDNDVTEARWIKDQTATVNGWAGSQVQVGFQRLQNAGYLRRLRLFLPPTTGATTLNAGTFNIQGAGQVGPYRAISRFTLVTQAISNLIDLRGEDFHFLNYVRNGDRARHNGLANYAFGASNAGLNTGNATGNWLTQNSVTANNGTLTLAIDIPMTEIITFRDTVVRQASSQGGPVLADVDKEVGLISLQNSQFAIQPRLVLNPHYSTGVNAPFLTTGAAVDTVNATFTLGSEIYDVPADPNDRPPLFQRALIVTRQNIDHPASGGLCNITFAPAGFLLRTIYAFYDTNDNLVDISAAGPNVQFVWGSTVIKIDETIQMNYERCLRWYGWQPPLGIAVHDFLGDDGTLAEAVNTAQLVNVRAMWTGLPGSVVNVRTIEERLVPIKLAA
jgi:hypothetical protein